MPELGDHQSIRVPDGSSIVHQPLSFVLGGLVRLSLGKGPIISRGVGGSRLGCYVNYGSKKQYEVRDEAFHGTPNFVLDVFYSKNDQDFLRLQDRFCRFGVHEYLVVFDGEPAEFFQHRLEANGYRFVEPNEDGIIRSQGLPNL